MGKQQRKMRPSQLRPASTLLQLRQGTLLKKRQRRTRGSQLASMCPHLPQVIHQHRFGFASRLKATSQQEKEPVTGLQRVLGCLAKHSVQQRRMLCFLPCVYRGCRVKGLQGSPKQGQAAGGCACAQGLHSCRCTHASSKGSQAGGDVWSAVASWERQVCRCEALWEHTYTDM